MRYLILTLLLTFALLVGCTNMDNSKPNNSSISDETSKSAISSTSTAIEEDLPNEEQLSMAELKEIYPNPKHPNLLYSDEYYTIPGWLIDFVGTDKFDEWLEIVTADRIYHTEDPIKYLQLMNEGVKGTCPNQNIVNCIIAFDVSKEEFDSIQEPRFEDREVIVYDSEILYKFVDAMKREQVH